MGDSSSGPSEQIGGFPMEAPAMQAKAARRNHLTAVPAAVATAPVSQTEQTEQTDDHASMAELIYAWSGQTARSSVAAHPSSQPLQKKHPNFRTEITLRRRTPPITCSACDVTYLTGVALPSSVPAAHWVCATCLGDLLGSEPAEVTEAAEPLAPAPPE
jgi:hypothetical protein